jgi:hypothetical protein
MFLFELFPFIMGKKILFHAKLNENNINFPKLYSAQNVVFFWWIFYLP